MRGNQRRQNIKPKRRIEENANIKFSYHDALQRERINGKWSHTFSVPILQPLAGTELIQNINIYFFYFLYRKTVLRENKKEKPLLLCHESEVLNYSSTSRIP